MSEDEAKALRALNCTLSEWPNVGNRPQPEYEYRNQLVESDEPCWKCGDGDPVPAKGYWKCPVCDAEWIVDDDGEGEDHTHD